MRLGQYKNEGDHSTEMRCEKILTIMKDDSDHSSMDLTMKIFKELYAKAWSYWLNQGLSVLLVIMSVPCFLRIVSDQFNSAYVEEIDEETKDEHSLALS